MSEKNIKKIGTRKNIITVLVVIIIGYLSYAIYSAFAVKKAVTKHSNSVYEELKAASLLLGLDNPVIKDFVTAYNSANTSVKAQIQLLPLYSDVKWVIDNRADSVSTFEQNKEYSVDWQLNKGKNSTFITRILF